MSLISPEKLPLLLHTLTETPASLSFLLTPESQLPHATPEAVLILRSYGALLGSTSLLSLWFTFSSQTDPESTRIFSLAMALYHLFPIYRAWARMSLLPRTPQTPKPKKVLGGPRVHFWVHIICFLSLIASSAATTK
ncbi:hypothetical protein QBC47DRAFT_372686 [Echria macrotheca]|uniref:Uncharacterized protein n=1 Tax=Echria macrotheca TaxID=438768 RepID=A0AAJ0BJY0_9PEZI|nr:hypothetical protein QBC47DRAFT_372686 [Echria macrotheca]